MQLVGRYLAAYHLQICNTLVRIALVANSHRQRRASIGHLPALAVDLWLHVLSPHGLILILFEKDRGNTHAQYKMAPL